MRISNKLLALFFALLGLIVILATLGFPKYPGSTLVGPAMFPRIVGAGFIACAVILFFQPASADEREKWIAWEHAFSTRRNVVNFLAVPLTAVVYLAAVDAVGFIPTAGVLLAVLFLLFGHRPWRALVGALVLAVAIHALFYKLLSVPLPWGVLEPFAW